MKTVTREEVERVLTERLPSKYYSEMDSILNELFPPEFKEGDWLVRIWPSGKETMGKAVFKNGKLCWKCEESYEDEGGVYKGELYGFISGYTNGKSSGKLRHATPEEIAAATWEEGKLYKVWSKYDYEWKVRVSAKEVGHFYRDGCFHGAYTKHYKYEKL